MDDCDWVSSLYYLLQTDQKDKVVKYDIAPCIDGFAGNISLVYKSREEAVFGTYVARFGPFKKKKDCVKAAARCCVEDLKKDWKTLLLPFAAGAAIICAAGPVRVCHNSSRSAVDAGTATARIRRNSSRSLRARHATRP